MTATIQMPKYVYEDRVPDETFAWWECLLATTFGGFTRVEGVGAWMTSDGVLDEDEMYVYTVSRPEAWGQQDFKAKVKYVTSLALVELGSEAVRYTIGAGQDYRTEPRQKHDNGDGGCQHEWSLVTGPETGAPYEAYFECVLCGAMMYRCWELDGSVTETITPPEHGDEPDGEDDHDG